MVFELTLDLSLLLLDPKDLELLESSDRMLFICDLNT